MLVTLNTLYTHGSGSCSGVVDRMMLLAWLCFDIDRMAEWLNTTHYNCEILLLGDNRLTCFVYIACSIIQSILQS